MHMRYAFYYYIAVQIFLFILIWMVNFKKRNHKFKNTKIISSKSKNESLSSYILYSSIRNQYFNVDDMIASTSYINENIYVLFNIYLKISPSAISAITKADKRLVSLKLLIDKDETTQEEISKELDNINNLLDKLISVSHEMIEKLEEVLDKPMDKISTLELSTNSVRAYTESVNIFMDLLDNHSSINYDIHYIFYEEYPELVDKFRIVSGKITYILFIFLITYSIKIDQNTYLTY